MCLNWRLYGTQASFLVNNMKMSCFSSTAKINTALENQKGTRVQVLRQISQEWEFYSAVNPNFSNSFNGRKFTCIKWYYLVNINIFVHYFNENDVYIWHILYICMFIIKVSPITNNPTHSYSCLSFLSKRNHTVLLQKPSFITVSSDSYCYRYQLLHVSSINEWISLAGLSI